MSNIYNHNRVPFSFKLDKSEYWDFFLSCPDFSGAYGSNSNNENPEMIDRCLVSYIDTNDCGSIWFDSLTSSQYYEWEDAVNEGLTLSNIGYTGVDNGLYTYMKDRITNADFAKIFKDSEVVIEANDNRLKLNKVDGNNQIYTYRADTVVKDDAICLCLNGGFYQGFFKSGCKYQILPTNIGSGICLEFTLNRSDLEKVEGDYLLNDRYPDNKGIFFYMGTRAENKWWKKFSIDETFDTISHDYFADDYMENQYVNDACAINSYLTERTTKDYLYNADGYLNNEYLDLTCGLEMCDDTNKSHPHGSGQGFGFSIKYPELYATYQFNSKWFSRDGKVMIENEDFTTNYNGGNSGKNNNTNYPCNCGNYFKDDYINEPFIVCDCERDYVKDDYVQLDILINESDFSETKDGYNVFQPNIVEIETDNKFLIFDRTCDGLTADDWEEGTTVVIRDIKPSTKENYFLLFNGTCGGAKANSFDKNNKEYNIQSDLYRNAFALQIKDDGSIGYKYLIKDCDSEEDTYKIESEFSSIDSIPLDEWTTITVKIVPIGIHYNKNTTATSFNQQMQIMIYVNGKLVLMSKQLPTFNFKKLNDMDSKQEGVPFNISLGGGTQGLCDVVYYDFGHTPTDILPLEKNFAGSFIGYIKSFKFYDCLLTFSEIQQNTTFEQSFYKN